MKSFLVLFSLFYNFETKAETRSALFLRAIIPPSITTSIKHHSISANQSLWVLSSQNNLKYDMEGQKIEFEGLEQSDLTSQIKQIITKDRGVQYEILISRRHSGVTLNKPIFLKISAN